MTEWTGSEGEGLEDEPDLAPSYGAPRPRSPRIGPEDVYTAADALITKGERVTIDRVRSVLGRGSPNTIQQHLDVWWRRLGSRLRDIPGQELPGVPSEVERDLLKLWETAVQKAQGALSANARARIEEVDAHEEALDRRARAIEEAAASQIARYEAQDAALALARDQLAAANVRAERLESSVQAREADLKRLEGRAQSTEQQARAERQELQATLAAQEARREKLEDRYEANEARWLQEVDRARQAVKIAAREQERAAKESLKRTEALEKSRSQLTRELAQVRAELKAALKVQRSSKAGPAKPGRAVSPASSSAKRETSRRRRG